MPRGRIGRGCAPAGAGRSGFAVGHEARPCRTIRNVTNADETRKIAEGIAALAVSHAEQGASEEEVPNRNPREIDGTRPSQRLDGATSGFRSYLSAGTARRSTGGD